MIKWLLLSGILYLVYRFYLKPAALGTSSTPKRVDLKEKPVKEEGEFIDYEELD